MPKRYGQTEPWDGAPDMPIFGMPQRAARRLVADAESWRWLPSDAELERAEKALASLFWAADAYGWERRALMAARWMARARDIQRIRAAVRQRRPGFPWDQ